METLPSLLSVRECSFSLRRGEKRMSDFWSMGGYAQYVWSVYGLAAVFLIGFLFVSIGGLRARREQLKRISRNRDDRRRS